MFLVFLGKADLPRRSRARSVRRLMLEKLMSNPRHSAHDDLSWGAQRRFRRGVIGQAHSTPAPADRLAEINIKAVTVDDVVEREHGFV